MTPPRGSRGLDDEIYARRRRKRRRVERKHTRRRAVVLALVAVLALLFVVAGAAVTGVATFGSSCDLNSLQQVEIGSNTFIYAADNSRLGVIPAERNRQPVPFKRISAWMPKATVAIEDRRFYQHDGIDVEGIARALWKNVSAGQVVEGGSTITQQLVRNLYIGREKTVERKLKEACLAIKLDKAWAKNRILATYMNQVYYGNLAYGIEAAAQTYFSKHASELNLPEAAMLAGLPQAPSDYNPFQKEEVAKGRRNQVLQALLNEGDITQQQYDWAVKRALGLKAGKLYKEIREPDFFGYVRDQLIDEYGAGTVRSGGLKVYTTIDPRFQRAAQKAIRETLYEHDDPAAGVISINPKNGAIRAMTAVIPGNKKNQFNLLSQARRQSGSTFKTFVLAAAVEQGINPETTTYLSAPFFYRPDPNGNCDDGTWWCPETYDHSYTGWTTIERATLRSDNTVYAQLTLDVTPEAVAKMATQARRPLAALRRRRLRPVDRPRRDGRLAARHGVGVRDARRRRDLLRADGDPEGDPPDRRGQERGLGQAEAQARDLGRRRLDGHEDPRGERPVRHRCRGQLRCSGRGQDGHHRGALRCLVLRLHAAARDDRLGRLPAGQGADDERARDRRRRRHLPGPDLAALHELRDRAARAGRLPRAEGLPRVEGLRARPVRQVVRLLPGQRLHAAGDDDRDDGRPSREQTDSVPDAPPASQPPPKQTPPPVAPPPATTRRRPPRRRRPPSPSCPDARHPARGGCGRAARRGLRRLRVGRGCAARAGGRRPRGRRLARSALPRAARPRLRRVPDGARAAAARVAGASRGGRRGLRDPADPARRPAARLDGRVDVLGVRPDRGGARRRSVRRHAERVPGRSRLRQGRRGLARHDVGVRACVHARSPKASRSCPAPRPRRRRGSSRCSRRSACWPARCSRRGSPAPRPTRRRSSAGTRSSRSTSPAAATTTRS